MSNGSAPIQGASICCTTTLATLVATVGITLLVLAILGNVGVISMSARAYHAMLAVGIILIATSTIKFCCSYYCCCCLAVRAINSS